MCGHCPVTQKSYQSKHWVGEKRGEWGTLINRREQLHYFAKKNLTTQSPPMYLVGC